MSEQQLADLLRFVFHPSGKERSEPGHCDRIALILWARYCTDSTATFREIGQNLDMSGSNAQRLQIQAFRRLRGSFRQQATIRPMLVTRPRLYEAVYGEQPS